MPLPAIDFGRPPALPLALAFPTVLVVPLVAPPTLSLLLAEPEPLSASTREFGFLNLAYHVELQEPVAWNNVL